GGTWDLFRYPGIRSDSDMFTLGYSFRPWKEAKTVAEGPAILQYLRETAEEFGIDRHIRFQQRVRSASWSSQQARWTVEVTRGEDKELVSYTCHFLYLCSGYYDYEQGHAPQFAGSDDFQGQLIHPQQWPGSLDYRDKRIVVIGSGATAVTLIPALAQTAAHVTMLQRSPTYLLVLPTDDRVAQMLGKLCPEWLAHRLTRWKNVLLGIYFYQLCRRSPERAKKFFRAQLAKELPPNFDIETHFQPHYGPWDQRVCIVPDANLFRTIRDGRVSVVTDQIANLTKHGVALQSGRELQADIIVTATGLKLLPCGGVRLFVDGEAVEPGQSLTYKGVMLSNVPNLAACVGYINAAWTLRADLSSAYVCRLLNYMDRHGYTSCMPRWDDAALEGRPLLGLTSGYVQRAADLFPKQGAKAPWLLHQNYLLDLLTLHFSRVNDGFVVFSKGSPRAVPHRKVSPLTMHNSEP
ncbi:MAG TPA: NAD(P)/FAD-dependent oxidoreductase, partial [Gemmataceae bacterium]|nr:NAD(P)/FAD-dependent oxidoreductase [Gemmataceae bacterium]